MRILLVIPITGLSKANIDERLEFLQSIAFPGTEIAATQIKNGPPAIESQVDHEIAAPEILKLVKQAEEDGYDAAIIWCAGDPALAAARELVDIPVIGPGQSAMLIASMLGENPFRINPITPVLDLRKNLSKTIEELKELIQLAKEKGADAFYFGCLGLWGLGRTLRAETGLPIVDPGESSLKMAEIAVMLGLQHSRIAYPKYPPPHRT